MSNFGDYAESLPNGYDLAKDQKKSCRTCGAFKDGYCDMYYMPVEAGYTCEDWVKNWKIKITISN